MDNENKFIKLSTIYTRMDEFVNCIYDDELRESYLDMRDKVHTELVKVLIDMGQRET